MYGINDLYYTYDANNRLTDLRVEGIYEDPKTGNEYTDWDVWYDYDNNGNLLSSIYYLDPDYCPTKTYQYNAWGQLTEYSDGYGNKSTYTYWADGLRQSKKVGSNTFKYYYNGGNVINETKNNSEHATNVMGVDGILSRKNGSLNGYYWKDAHGNVVYIFGGYRYSDYDYNAWGEEQRRYDWHKDFNPMLYCGEYYDDESGLQYLRGRYYSPEIRRFITEDPAKDGLNWYAYCGNNPVMRVDVSGFEWASIRSLAQSLVDTGTIYTGGVTYTATGRNSVKVKIGEGYYYKSGEFYYNGDAEIYRNGGRSTYKEHIAENVDGSLYMDRTDFYRAMNIKYAGETQNYSVTATGNLILSSAVTIGTSVITNGAKDVVNGAISLLSGGITSLAQKPPGEYQRERILGEVYNQATNRYEYILTETTYVLYDNEYGKRDRSVYSNFSVYMLSSEESLL